MSPEVKRRLESISTSSAVMNVRPRSHVLRRDVQAVRPGADRRLLRAPVMGEAVFRSVLQRERKRMERSTRSFALLLVGVDETACEDSLVVWGPIADGLRAAKRDTDVLGWYERGSALGVVLTELESTDAAVVAGIENRVREEIARRLDDRSAAAVSVQLFAHPDLKESTGEVSAPEPLRRVLGQGARRGDLYDGLKRGLDLVAASMLLVLLAPVFLAIAALVKLTSKGPVFFKQVRVGEQAKPFKMLKFRTMYTGADAALHQEFVKRFIASSADCKEPVKDAPFKIAHDPRITPLGRILRKTSLDELPQLWNVVRGDMSLVGPRPPLFYEVEMYQPWHRRRVLDAKPGITGLWQVEGRSRTTFDEMVRLDLRYARRRSLWNDMRILLATPKAVVTGKGAA